MFSKFERQIFMIVFLLSASPMLFTNIELKLENTYLPKWFIQDIGPQHTTWYWKLIVSQSLTLIHQKRKWNSHLTWLNGFIQNRNTTLTIKQISVVEKNRTIMNARLFQGTNFKEPLRIFSEEELEGMALRYYSTEVHHAAFVLPRFARLALDAVA